MAPSIEGKRPEVKSPMSTTCCNREEITPRYRVTVVGSGNWGSVAAKLIASNTAKLPIFHDEVRMWVFEEILPGGEKLSKAINQTNGRGGWAKIERSTRQYEEDREAGTGIAVEKFSEATIGYRQDKEVAQRWARLFCTPYFLVSVVQDVEGVELCGTLKNVVAIAAGLVDGMNMGNNTKAAIMRIGLREMRALSKLLFPSVRDSTFFESCGVADLITTCLGGRNRKVAEAFAKGDGKRSFDELEAELLGGQKLQGVSTAKEVYEILSHRGWQAIFPLFMTVHEICIGQLPSSAIVEYSEQATNFSIVEGLAQYC
ncbi:NAD-dependent glycerol-3-phosphate dehydrogenase C-terminus [Musa troglodytarum]|uniref:glycerol-3-phosphate dehydrogenase (NAD(+)) n=1 Tax=Musa troglodytarum TaxID=320322 RepID=A0A9E7HVP2_9LILI|nr:NAD-dependent glycerol-3-phosphate dehydrogenase C-terminus [Musa troglodytarum]